MKALCTILLLPLAASITIPEINGNHFLSAHRDEDITNLTGLVTATSSKGVYLRSTEADTNTNTRSNSQGIYIYGTTATSAGVSVGDVISLNGHVSEYRSAETDLYNLEITSASDISVSSSGHDVSPRVILGKDGLAPPNEQFTALDDGNVFGLPANTSRISEENPRLKPGSFGLDFWQSLSGELVSISRPRAVDKPNRYGDTWVVGDWDVGNSGNERGGVTVLPKGSFSCFSL